MPMKKAAVAGKKTFTTSAIIDFIYKFVEARIERGLASATGASTRKISVEIYPCPERYAPNKNLFYSFKKLMVVEVSFSTSANRPCSLEPKTTIATK